MIRDKTLILSESNLEGITTDNIKVNKTYLLLSHVLRDYGDAFIKAYFNSGILAMGIGDTKYSTVKGHSHMYAIFTLHENSKCKSFISLIRNKPFYLDDYVFEIAKCPTKHFSVILIPEKYYKTYTNFIQSRFSEMFTNKDLIEFRLNTHKKGILWQAYCIFTKKEEYFPNFQDNINKYFKTTVALDHNREFALPLNKQQEVFFYTVNE